jgi:[histone H3]-lysine36 N-dimethyltransferase SETMAR
MTLLTIGHLDNTASQDKNRKKNKNNFCKFYLSNNPINFYARPTKVKTSIADFKQMLIVAFHKNRVLAYKIIPRNQNINFEIYHEFLSQTLHSAITTHRIHRPIILHDNARPHKHSKIQEFFATHRWEELKHPPYSPDLNPCDFEGIAKIKKPNKDTKFGTPAELEQAYSRVIYDLNVKQAFNGISHLPARWGLVKQQNGDYIS